MKYKSLIASVAIIALIIGTAFGTPLFRAAFAETDIAETTGATDEVTATTDTGDTVVEDTTPEDEESADEEATDGDEETTETTVTSNTGSPEQTVLSTNTSVINNNNNENNNVNENVNNVEVNPVIENHVSNYVETNNTREVVYETEGGYEVYEEPVVYETPETGTGSLSLIGLLPAGLIGFILRKNLLV